MQTSGAAGHAAFPAPATEEPTTAEEAMMSAMISLGRRLRPRLPGDAVDFSALPLLKTLQLHGPMRISALAGLLQLDASTVSRHARQLETRGLIARTGDPDDGRASQVTVSEHGVECLVRHAGRRQELIASVLADWPAEDREQLRVLLARFDQDLSRAAAPSPTAPAPPRPLQENP